MHPIVRCRGLVSLRSVSATALIGLTAIPFASSLRAAPEKSQTQTAPPAAVFQAGPAPVTVSLPIDTLDTAIPSSNVYIRPVTTTNIDGKLRYLAFQGDFTFDETVCSFSLPYVEKAGLTSGNWS